MENKNLIYTIALYSFIIAAFISGICYIVINREVGTNIWYFFKLLFGAWLVSGLTIYFLLSKVSQMVDEAIPEEYDDNTVTTPLTPGEQYYYNDYCNGFCRVEKITIMQNGEVSSEFNFLDKKGNYISEKWYAAVSDFYDNGIALVTDGEQFNFINTEGKLICTTWYYGLEPFVDGIAKVRWKDNTVNFIDIEGNYLWEEWRPEIILNKNNDPDNND